MRPVIQRAGKKRGLNEGHGLKPLLSYLKVTGKQVGLLLNFGGAKPEFQRLFFAPREPKVVDAHAERAFSNHEHPDLVAPEMVYDIVGGLFEVHATLGPGLIHRIYANACYYELKLRDLPARRQKTIQIFYRDISLGELKFGHLCVGNTVIVFPTAIQSIADLKLDALREWLRVQRVPLGILANFNDTELKPIFLKPRSD